MSKKIDKKCLVSNGWKEGNELSIPGFGNFVDYCYDLDNFHFIITFGNSNSGRIATLHIDNQVFQSIGSVDIDTIEQFNLMMNIVDCDYELH